MRGWLDDEFARKCWRVVALCAIQKLQFYLFTLDVKLLTLFFSGDSSDDMTLLGVADNRGVDVLTPDCNDRHHNWPEVHSRREQCFATPATHTHIPYPLVSSSSAELRHEREKYSSCQRDQRAPRSVHLFLWKSDHWYIILMLLKIICFITLICSWEYSIDLVQLHDMLQALEL